MRHAHHLIPYLSLLERALPKELLPPLVRLSGQVLARLQTGRREAVNRNLARLGIRTVDDLGRRAIGNWTRCVADQLRLPWLSSDELQAMVVDEWSENLRKSEFSRTGLVLVTGHLGNYELAGAYLASCGLPVHAVVEDIPGHTGSYDRIRRSFGMGVVSYSDIPGMIRVLRSGRILVMLADRDLGGKGIEVEFGKGRRRVPAGAAMLALRTGARLQTGYLVMDDQAGKYRCVIRPFFTAEREGSLNHRVELTTRRITEQLVDAIRACPDQWFVFQDEWN